MKVNSMSALLARTVNVDYLVTGEQSQGFPIPEPAGLEGVNPNATYMVSRWDFPADLHCKGSALPSILAKLPGASYTLSGGPR